MRWRGLGSRLIILWLIRKSDENDSTKVRSEMFPYLTSNENDQEILYALSYEGYFIKQSSFYL